MAKVLKITQRKGASKATPKQAATLRSIGLTGIGSSVVRKDLMAVRGMLNHLQHWVDAEQLDAPVKIEKKSKSKSYKILK